MRHVLLDAIVNPASAVTADTANTCPLLLAQSLKELLEHTFTVILMHPHHFAGVVVDDDGHVFMALAIGRLVDANVDEPFETPLVCIGIQMKLCPLNAAADRFPIDAHEFFDA